MLYGILRKQDDALLAIIEAGSEASAIGFGQELCPMTFGRVEPHDDSHYLDLLEALTRSLASTGMAEADARTHAASVLAEKPVGTAVPRFRQMPDGEIVLDR